jgi:flagellar hook protein FlgE
MDAIAYALSGMQAASLQLDVSANNVANLPTPGFTPSEVGLSAASGGGVAARVAPGPPPSSGPSGTDLLAETATAIAAPVVYAANARIVTTSAQMAKSLFDAYA